MMMKDLHRRMLAAFDMTVMKINDEFEKHNSVEPCFFLRIYLN